MQIRATQVRDIMTPDPRVIEPGATVREAWATMKENGFRHLPVVDAGRLVGVISIPDIGRLGATVPAILERTVAQSMTPDPMTSIALSGIGVVTDVVPLRIAADVADLFGSDDGSDGSDDVAA